MDNNNPNPPVNQPVNQPAPPPQPIPTPDGGNKKMILWIVVGLVLVILIFGVLFFMSNQNKQEETATSTKPIPKPSAPSQNIDALEKDLNSTALDDLDKEFTTVDTDLKEL